MFDDHTPQSGGAVPQNLPFGEPEDILAGVDAAAEVPGELPPVAATSSDPAPAALQSPSALSAGVLKPKESTPMVSPILPRMEEEHKPVSPIVPSPHATIPPASPMAGPPAVPAERPMPTSTHPLQQHTLPTDAPEMYAVKEPRASKGIITGIIIVVVVLVLGGGGVFVYNQFVANSGATLDNNDSDFVVEGDSVSVTVPFVDEVEDDIVPVEEAEIVVSDTDTQNDILFGEPADTDADGLDDTREEDLGTDAAHWDTDGDELSDGDEVIIWKTDPLNPDSDADGFSDGTEIKNGYSPTGPGKIFEPPAAVTTTTP